METTFALLMGVGLAAACGFRIFVPFFVVSVAALTGQMDLPSSFAWIGTYPAAIAFGVATVLEVAAYYIPLVDNLLDTVATPAAVVAGTVVTASMLGGDVSPLFKWMLAAIAGGGAAAAVQTATVATRAVSATTTGGAANPVVSTAELGGSVLTSILAIMLPVIAVILVAAAIGMAIWYWRRRRVVTLHPTVV